MWAGGALSPRARARALAAGCLASACLAAYEWRHRHRLGHGDGGGGGRRRGMMSLLLAARDAIVGVRSAPWHEDDDADLPEEFVDPITLTLMEDPCLLCGTGQVYCFSSLRSWLQTGSRKCPKTNITMRDMQVVRLPALRNRIAAWRSTHGLPPLPPLDPPPEVLRAAGEECAALLSRLRCGDVFERGLAAGRVNDLLIEWGCSDDALAERRLVMEAMLLDLVWLMRQGGPFGAGVAAAALSQYSHPAHAALLSAVAAPPAVGLLWSPHPYAQHSAARLLSSLAHAAPPDVAEYGRSTSEVLVEAGAVGGLLRQLDLSVPFEYARCSAASALWGCCKCEAGRAEARAGGALRLLKRMVLQAEEAPPPGPDAEFLVRYEKRDAAGCLLQAGISAAEAAEEPAVDLAALRQLKYCSSAWLQGSVAGPAEGWSAEEEATGVPQLAAGLGGEAEGDEGVDEEQQVDAAGEVDGGVPGRIVLQEE